MIISQILLHLFVQKYRWQGDKICPAYETTYTNIPMQLYCSTFMSKPTKYVITIGKDHCFIFKYFTVVMQIARRKRHVS